MTKTYGFSIEAGNDFDRVLAIVIQELKKQGFGIVSDIDIQAIFKEKLAVNERRYRILGACNPMLAQQALRADPDIGLLLPCNVVVREGRNGEVVVAFTSPEALMGLVDDDDVVILGEEVRRRLERVSDAVTHEAGAPAS